MFLISDVGCYADGALGHQHVRDKMADLLERLYRHHPRGGNGLYWESDIKALVAELRGEMSDDASEEYEAIEWLNRECYDDTRFELIEGNLVLVGDDLEDY